MHSSTVEECQENLKNIIYASVGLFFFFGAFIQLHFVLVVFSHSKNYMKDVDQDANEAKPFTDEQP